MIAIQKVPLSRALYRNSRMVHTGGSINDNNCGQEKVTGFPSKPSEWAQVHVALLSLMARDTQSPLLLILKIWGPRLSFLCFRTCALPRCTPTSPSMPPCYPRPKLSSSPSTEPPVGSTTRSGASQVFSCGGCADMRTSEHKHRQVPQSTKEGLRAKGWSYPRTGYLLPGPCGLWFRPE